MIFDFIFFSEFPIDSSLFNEKEQNAGNDYVVGYFINNIDNTWSDFFCQPSFFNKGNGRFCLALESSILVENIQGKLTDNLVEVLGPIFFNHRYFTLNGIPLINVLVSIQEEKEICLVEPDRLLDLLNLIFHQLGYEAFYYCLINKSNMQMIKTNIPFDFIIYKQELSSYNENPKEWYLDFLENKSTTQRLIFFFTTSSMPINSIFSELRNAEVELKKKNPRLFAMLEEKAIFAKQLEHYEINLRGLKKEIESKEEYIANFHMKSAMKKMVDFYHYEYEILPTWYKRLGHIIKVITGKRTFRSLFSDKVKKYKN